MICAKCGFDQMDSRECIRCGVVIAKYLVAMKRRESLDNKPSPSLRAVMDYPPPADAPQGLRSSAEESSNLWEEQQYLKADMGLLTDGLRSLQTRADHLEKTTGECAKASALQRVIDDMAEISHKVSAIHAGMVDLARIHENLRAAADLYPSLVQELDKVKSDVDQALTRNASFEEIQRLVSTVSTDVNLVKDRMDVDAIQNHSAKDCNEKLANMASRIDTLHAELQEMSGMLSRGNLHEMTHAPVAGEIMDLKLIVSQLQEDLSELRRSPHSSAPPNWEALREEWLVDAKRLILSEVQQLSSRWVEQLQAQVLLNLNNRLDTLTPTASETRAVQEDLAGLSERVQSVESTLSHKMAMDLSLLQQRIDTLSPKIEAVDRLESTVAEHARLINGCQSEGRELTAIVSRMETLESLPTSGAQTLERSPDLVAPDTQLESLKRWSTRVQPGSLSRNSTQATLDLCELKDDIKVIKVLVSDLVKRVLPES
ncbi:MAG: hypothetical protein HYR55_04040 [Acidobacteria bacterium]|nr:hypothetical protein [Acidobacteriota bacterium]MBI3657500.1 hypothetical protein [Acidobacteriota bacterium]